MLNRFCVVALLGLAVLLPGCSRSRETAPKPPVKFHDEFFGLDVVLPGSWQVMTSDRAGGMARDGVEEMAGENKKMRSQLAESMTRTRVLVSAFAHPPGEGDGANPSVSCAAENIQGMGKIDGRQSLINVREVLRGSRIPVEFSDQILIENLGGVDFYTTSATMEVDGITIHQKLYASVLKEHILTIGVSYGDNSQKSEVDHILQSVRFKSNQPGQVR